jgi:hypothetical protein
MEKPLEHLAVEDFVLFFTRRARCANAAGHEQSGANRD